MFQHFVIRVSNCWYWKQKSDGILASGGKGFEDLQSFDQEDWAYSLGGGLRYFLARKFNIYSGIDVARGPEKWAFYIQFGHYWNSL